MEREIRIEAAGDDDRALCLALIPGLAAHEVVHLIARQGGDIVGAAAIGCEERHDLEGFPLDVHVVPWARRQGVGTALCQAATELTRGETAGLWSEAGHAAGSAAHRFLERCGFAAARHYYFYGAALADYRDYVARSAARVRARGAGDIVIVPLRDAPLDQVAWLITAHFASSPITMLRTLLGMAASDRLSCVAMRGGRVAGALLGREEGDAVVIEAWAVDPRDRRGPVSPLLFEAALAAATGISRIEFHCDDRTRDTIAAAARGAELMMQRDLFYKAS